MLIIRHKKIFYPFLKEIQRLVRYKEESKIKVFAKIFIVIIGPLFKLFIIKI
jgi:hypothetical protein